MHDFQCRALGVAGEEWVIELERERLRRSGRDDLAHDVRWVAREDGDGAGYDIRSYRLVGAERLIEVEDDLPRARSTPFYITQRGNWSVSRAPRPDRTPSSESTDSRGIPASMGLTASRSEPDLEPKVFLGIPL